ncbi:LacI family DNA-binding transcriptional regulator [Curvibacter sp. CHRR-16]|uniref:LacI family DNA-binding transcriptional regulator n=1 Tax=Curvibacter sp. CHRR-16 TaxID=2835872 RepID=UPI001BD9829E|nr:LacI family DNA-binding transcriptional regulator [Curvibacter sp. CHRR-16]MBT0570310.1 LacI family DNA-binding transcriptional regulator [Curvibacter sp. CHRR-16]
MATLNEVARLAGVTTATVSNVLRNSNKVRPETIRKVEEAIRITGYQPNLMARALAEGKSSMVALVLPDISNPFYPEFVRVAERVARQRNFFLMVCNTDARPEVGCAYLRQIAGTLADGVLVLHTGLQTEDIQALKGRRSPVVLASEEKANLQDHFPHVLVDLARAGQLAAEHLLGLGHRRIGVIVGCGLEGEQHTRLDGFTSVLQQHGITLPPEAVLHVLDNVESGRNATHELLQRHGDLTALFATNDLLAMGVYQALFERGLRVPHDISVMGLTDIQLARELRPALSTVSLHVEELATLSVNLLLDLVGNPQHQPTILQVSPPTLVVRDSTASVAV